jgi:hypothetical protein
MTQGMARDLLGDVPWQLKLEAGLGDGFRIERWKGKERLIASTPLGLVSGAAQVDERSGTYQPRLSDRVLWLDGVYAVPWGKGTTLGVPEELVSGKADAAYQLAKRAIALGYNVLLLGSRTEERRCRYRSAEMQKLIGELRRYGLRVWVKFDGPLPRRLPEVDGVVWMEGLEENREHTLLEQLVADEASVRTRLPESMRLIYTIAAEEEDLERHAAWLDEFLDEVDLNTTVAFSALWGDPREQGRPLSPIWEALRATPDCSATPLLPVVDASSAAPPIDLLDRVRARMHRHPFAGLIVLAERLPKPGSLTHCALWCAGRLQWRDLAAELLAADWLRLFPQEEPSRPEPVVEEVPEEALV